MPTDHQQRPRRPNARAADWCCTRCCSAARCSRRSRTQSSHHSLTGRTDRKAGRPRPRRVRRRAQWPTNGLRGRPAARPRGFRPRPRARRPPPATWPGFVTAMYSSGYAASTAAYHGQRCIDSRIQDVPKEPVGGTVPSPRRPRTTAACRCDSHQVRGVRSLPEARFVDADRAVIRLRQVCEEPAEARGARSRNQTDLAWPDPAHARAAARSSATASAPEHLRPERPAAIDRAAPASPAPATPSSTMRPGGRSLASRMSRAR